MKRLLKTFTLVGALAGLISCEGELVVPAQEGEAADGLPEFNFLVRQLAVPSQEDTFAKASNDTLVLEIYLKQLDFEAPTESYTLIVSFPDNLEGRVLYNQRTYRSQDWIELPYESLVNHVTTLAVVVEAPAGQTSYQQQHTLSLVCRDRSQKAKTATVTLALAAPSVDTPDTVAADNQRLPQFNFLVRQLATPSVDTATAVVDTMDTATVDTVALAEVADTIPVEIYLKQVDFLAPDENYTLVVSFPADFAGEIRYQDTTYRSGDWIKIAYRQLVQNTTVIEIVPFPSQGPVSKDPLPKKEYLMGVICQDRLLNTKSATLALTF